MLLRRLTLIVPLAAFVAVGSFLVVRAGSDPTDRTELGLSDDERQSIHATAVADSVVQIRANAIEFGKSGASLDALPRTEILATTGIYTQELDVAAKAADVVVFVQSEGAYVDENDGSLRIRLRVIETLQGEPKESLDIGLAGGPAKTQTGEWVMGVAPYELYLSAGETAILLLERSEDGSFRQRPYEAMLVEGDRIVARDRFAFNATLANMPVDQALARLRAGAR